MCETPHLARLLIDFPEQIWVLWSASRSLTILYTLKYGSGGLRGLRSGYRMFPQWCPVVDMGPAYNSVFFDSVSVILARPRIFLYTHEWYRLFDSHILG